MNKKFKIVEKNATWDRDGNRIANLCRFRLLPIGRDQIFENLTRSGLNINTFSNIENKLQKF